MRKSRARKSRFTLGLTGAAGLLTAAGAGVAVVSELRHRSALAHDPDWELLHVPLEGKPVTAVSADGTELHAEVFGSAKAPTFLLVPGWTEELQVFDLLTRGLLGHGFRVVGFDLRGQGRSGGDAGLDQSIERYGEDVTAVLEATCHGRDDVIVAGHSMGGMSIVAWAGVADVSRYVRAAALIATGMATLVDDLTLLPAAIPFEARRQILAHLLAGDQPIFPVSTPVSRALNRHVMFGPHATAAQIAFVEPMIWRMRPKLRAAAAVTMRTLDLTGSLARLTVPTLVIVGDVDRLTPPVHAQRMVAALPHVAEFTVLPETGHMVPLERPVELLEALERLAASVGLEPGAAVVVKAKGSKGSKGRKRGKHRKGEKDDGGETKTAKKGKRGKG
jgi:pimeloyl-ACP methyl ester carboxylesterase